MELNPNNPITSGMRDQWHKIVAVLMADYGIVEFEITPMMLDDFAITYPGGAVVADARDGRFVIRLVSGDEAERLARKEGGLPA